MGLTELLFSLDGRIGRARFWLGMIMLTIASIVAIKLILALVGISQAAVAFSAAVGFAFAYPTYAVMAKRFQDRNKPGALALIGLVPAYGANLLYTLDVLDPVERSVAAQILDVIIVCIFLWFLIELGLLQGTQGPNRYGSDPLGHHQADASLE